MYRDLGRQGDPCSTTEHHQQQTSIHQHGPDRVVCLDRALLIYEGLKIWWHAMIMMAMMPIGPIHFSCLHLLSTWHICQLLSGRKFYGSASVQPPIPRHLSSRVLALCHRLRWAEQLACCTVIHDSRTNLSIQQHGKRWWPCCSKRSEPSNNNNVFFLEENTTDDKRNQTPIFLRRSTGH